MLTRCYCCRLQDSAKCYRVEGRAPRSRSAGLFFIPAGESFTRRAALCSLQDVKVRRRHLVTPPGARVKSQMQFRGESLSPLPTPRIDELSAEERAVYATLKPERIPEHVAIIMDGNGRWACRRSLKRFLGHQQGAKSVQLVTETASRIGLPWLTLYAFSLENSLRRPRAEVNFLMRLLKTYLENNVQRMMNNNVRMRYIGRIHDLPSEVQDKMQWVEETTARNTGTTLTLALNYGGRSELVDAFRGLAAEMKAKHLNPERHHGRRYSPPSLHGAHARPRSARPNLRRAAHLKLFALAGCVHRDFRHRAVLAGLSRHPPARSHCGRFSAENAVTAESAKTAAKWKKIPSRSRSRQVEGSQLSQPAELSPAFSLRFFGNSALSPRQCILDRE